MIQRTPLLVVLALTATGLAGCAGDLAPDMHPGAAAVIGDTTIGFDEVDELARDICGIAGGEARPLGFFRAVAVGNLAGYEAARQYAEARDLEPVETLQQELAAIEQEIEASRERGADITEEEQQLILDLERRHRYRDAVLLGTDDPEAAFEDYTAWVEELDPAIDPRFGEANPATGEYRAPDGLSVRLDDISLDAAADLPADQRCG